MKVLISCWINSVHGMLVVRLRGVCSFACQFTTRCVYNALYTTNEPPGEEDKALSFSLLFTGVCLKPQHCVRQATASCSNKSPENIDVPTILVNTRKLTSLSLSKLILH